MLIAVEFKISIDLSFYNVISENKIITIGKSNADIDSDAVRKNELKQSR